jgi:hypothetical protein
VAVNVAVVAPVATVTEEGRARNELLSDTATGAPPLGADLLIVTVQVVLEPDGKLEGLHATEDNVRWLKSVMVAVLEEEL